MLQADVVYPRCTVPTHSTELEHPKRLSESTRQAPLFAAMVLVYLFGGSTVLPCRLCFIPTGCSFVDLGRLSLARPDGESGQCNLRIDVPQDVIRRPEHIHARCTLRIFRPSQCLTSILQVLVPWITMVSSLSYQPRFLLIPMQGWYAVRREWKRLMFVFLIIASVVFTSWILMLKSWR